jgi:benzoyl-CoA reductase/2-hydroxyglutaryl-CoA dehydratase subunit BcrC/BadD/HgdB
MALDDFLGLCGFSPSEQAEQMPRVTKAFAKAGLNDADVGRAIARIHRYFDVELEGVRKLLGIHLLSFLELVLAREEGKRKIIYGEWPLTIPIMMAVRRADPDSLVSTPAMICNVVMGQIFGKLVPITEAGEELGQHAGQAHCPLYQTHVGAIVKGIAPVPDLEMTVGFLCEPPVASMDILKHLYDIPHVDVDGTVDHPWGKWPEPYMRQVDYQAREIDRALEEIGEKYLGRPITEEAKAQAFKECAQGSMYLQMLMNLIAKSDPQPLSQVDAGLGVWLISTPMSPEQMKRVSEALMILYRETKERVDKGIGVVPKGSPRAYVSIIVAADPANMKLFEESGLSVPAAFITWQPPAVRFKMPLETFAERTAGFVQRSGIACSTYGAIEQILITNRELNLDGAVLCYATSCRLYSLAPMMAKKALQKEFGGDFPVIVLEGEFYDTRNYSAEQMRTRVETFAQLLKERKEAQVT